jgi:hypothetical protein
MVLIVELRPVSLVGPSKSSSFGVTEKEKELWQHWPPERQEGLDLRDKQ